MNKDYYKILGVQEYESSENIKSAYRKLARRWHPDVAGNSAEVLLKFKDINEAYGVLSNPLKKEEYDRARRFYNYSKKGYEEKKSASENHKYDDNPNKNSKNEFEKKGFSFNWEEFLSKQKMERAFAKNEKPQPKNGADINTEIEISVFESIEGAEKIINILQTGVCPKCKGRKFANGAECSFCHGKGEVSSHKKFTVKIPSGIKNNSKIRLSGEGAAGENGGKNGDLYITVKIKEPSGCKTEGLNVLKLVPITPFEAVLGTIVEVRTLGGNYTVKIPPNTQNGQKIRLSKCGMVQNDKVGDMIITVEIRLPDVISEEEKALYKKLEALSKGSIRDNIYDR